MVAFCYYLAWDWISVAIECTAASWSRLPHFFLTIVGVNLVTHSLFILLLALRTVATLRPPVRIRLFLVEWTLLVVVYDRSRWRRLGLVAFVMNVSSYGTGLLMEM